MARFDVFDELDLGEAVWRSRPGDAIFLRKGQYGRVVLKAGTLVFPQGSDASIGQIAGVMGDCDLVDAQWRPENIRSVFVYRKRLPINLRLPEGFSCLHPSGAAVSVVRHETGSENITADGGVSVEAQLPKAVVDVEVPSTADVDFGLLRKEQYSPEELLKRSEEHVGLQRLLSRDDSGSPFGEVEYVALWALNHFLRRYSIIAELGPAKGLSFAEFRDGVTIRYKRPGPDPWIMHSQGYIKNFNSIPLSKEEQQRLFRECLDAPDYSLVEYIDFALEHLNYSMAVTGMEQLLEANGLAGKWWRLLEDSGLNKEQQRLVAEVKICRNVILHQHECAIKENAQGFTGARERFGIEPVSEYRLYATKLPWRWYQEGVLPYLALRSSSKGVMPSEVPTSPLLRSEMPGSARVPRPLEDIDGSPLSSGPEFESR
jgi:hypothetical protein